MLCPLNEAYEPAWGLQYMRLVISTLPIKHALQRVFAFGIVSVHGVIPSLADEVGVAALMKERTLPFGGWRR